MELGEFWRYTPDIDEPTIELAVVAITRDKRGADVTLLEGETGRHVTVREEWATTDRAWEPVS